jgi:hypothetical protein
MLLWQLCKAAIRPGAGIESHFRYQHQLKGKLLRDIRDYCSAMELAIPKLFALPSGLGNFRSPWGKRKQPRSIAVFSFDINPVEGLKAASLTGCSHNSPSDGVSKADFDTR